MKENVFKKLVCVLIIVCMLAMMFVPTYVKSANVVVSNMSNTGRGIGKTSIYTVKINGYNNLYCVRGGATLKSGMQLSDDGVSLYTTTGAVVKDSSAIQWILDNMYLTEGTDANTQKVMRQNLINIMKKYNTYKDANGNGLLNQKLHGNGINDKWITNAIDDVLNDKTTLYAVQQYAIWDHVKNSVSAYDNTMKNSDGSYNAIPGAKAKQVHYTALYITLSELAAEAQKNGYKSPNNSGRSFDVQIEKQANTKVTVANDGKSALIGPYKLKNNHSSVSKSFSATINSDKADKVETVNASGNAVSVSETQGEFYVKVTYNKGFAKGTKYNIGINVGLSGYKTIATLLDTTNKYHQPLVTIRKQPYNSNTKTEIVEEENLNGDYSLVLEKISVGGEKVSGVTFKVKEGNGEEKAYGPTDSNGEIKVFEGKQITKEGVDEYTITEVNVGKNKLIKVQDQIKIYVTKAIADGKYVVSKASFEKDKDAKEKTVTLEDGTKGTVTMTNTNSLVKVIVPNKKDEPKEFDLALRKNIAEIKRDGKNVDIGNDRNPEINVNSATKYLQTKTAGYYHTKNPVTVKPGDTVVYSIRVYNEGYIDGYAKEITDYLPAGLEFIKDSQINKDNGWTATENQDGTTTVKTNKLQGELIKASQGADGFLNYVAQKSAGNSVKEPEFSKVVQIECKIKDDVQDSKLLVNVAEITNYGYTGEDGNYVEANKDGVDVDSEEDNVFKKNDKIKNIDDYYNNNVKPQYKEDNKDYKGEQDDDDFENVIVKPDSNQFKFVLNKVDEEGNPLIGADFTVERFKENKNDVLLDNKEVKGTYEVLEDNVKINTTYLYKVVEVESAPQYVNVMNGKYITIATYMNSDKKLVLGAYQKDETANEYYSKYGFTINNNDGSIVTKDQTDLYDKIKVAIKNETEPQQVTITIPNEKEVIPGKYNIQIKKVDAKDQNKVLQNAVFTVLDRNKISSEVTTNASGIATIAKDVDITKTEKDKTSVDNYVIAEKSVPDGYVLIKDHQLIVRVTTGLTSDNKNYEVKDVDVSISQKSGSENTQTEKEMLEKGVSKTISGNTITITIPNNPEEKEFDLALRKFITGVNGKEVTTRIPVFKVDEQGNYIYEHTKEPVLVANSNIVTYTLRVYNEGEVAGYAKEIKDDVPEGLEFLPDDETNKEYRWIMLDKYGKETDNASDAKYITSDYLSKEQEKTAGENLLKAFDKKAYEAGSIKEPDYREVKISFKVNMPDKSEEIIINQAQISDDSDEDGNEVTDKDSTPNEWIDGEDDQDIEKIKIQYFDLALRKWVTKAIVTENGKETVTETGHKAEDDPEAVVKVDLKKSDINKVTVKFEYKIRVENQGKIAGYAKEISDYIPEGLEFVKEDNPLWEEVDGKVVTDQLKDTLLQPGETAEVSILLTWINSEDNMGLKVNTAEISKDYNEYGAPDIDSTPNNKVPGEDDIDDAPVMLSVTTGEEQSYVILTVAVLGILAGGLILVKKFVL
ncbi:MAG TPA: Cys-Gln thioester bond-forming surface protein [Clostridiaceae bacterium]|nr:Cys-Gln thioester bond-forming surface protein [Clostridiaceae bacterium]